ncbi:ribosomal RNA processing protein [Taxawa tesnikishii (nom. ined.)]|nr:ribosomal RNA processing protein [Dothideales sp. JES 119]
MSALKKRKIDDTVADEPLPDELPAIAAKKKRKLEKDAFPPEPEVKKARAETKGALASEDEADGEDGAGGAEEDHTDVPVTDGKPQKTFADLGIISELCDACTALGYKHPTPIQTESIPSRFKGAT